MQIRKASFVTLALCASFLLIAVSESSVVAQQSSQRRRPSRRITNPIPRQTQTDDISIVSTEEERAQQEERATSSSEATRSNAASSTRPRNGDQAANGATLGGDARTLQRMVDRLTTQVTKLTAELDTMREQQRELVNLERLSRAEQRAENYRAQLRDVVAREADLQARLEQIEFEIQPDNIEQRAAGFGSLRPEQLREQMRRRLENERTRTETQLQLLSQNRTRLETVIVSADAEVERLRTLLNEPNNDATATNANPAAPVDTSTTAYPATPQPTPTPEGSAEPPQ